MSNQISGSEAAKAIADPLGTFVAWLAGHLPEGAARTLLYGVTGLCVVILPFIYRYYLGLVGQGAQPDDSIERQDYDRLRASLAGGNLAARLYAKWLTKFLDWIERFFGDVGMADRTLFPHAFGLKKRAPLWTAAAFDRCLLLALIYPIATILLIWAISGDVGPAEAALGLYPDTPGWTRDLFTGAYFGLGIAIWASSRARKWKSLAFALVWAVALPLFELLGVGELPYLVAILGVNAGAVVAAGAGVGVVSGVVAIIVINLFGSVYAGVATSVKLVSIVAAVVLFSRAFGKVLASIVVGVFSLFSICVITIASLKLLPAWHPGDTLDRWRARERK